VIEQAVKVLLGNKFGAVPVVNADEKLVGIITLTDIVKVFQKLLEVDGKGTRIKLWVDDDPSSFCTISQIFSNNNMSIDNLVTIKNAGEKALLTLLTKNITDVETTVNDLKKAGFKVEAVNSIN
jgi:CBS domain-containing protein